MGGASDSRVGGAAGTSDRGDELLQPAEQLGVDLKVVEVMLHPVAAHVEHPATTSSLPRCDITLWLSEGAEEPPGGAPLVHRHAAEDGESALE